MIIFRFLFVFVLCLYSLTAQSTNSHSFDSNNNLPAKPSGSVERISETSIDPDGNQLSTRQNINRDILHHLEIIFKEKSHYERSKNTFINTNKTGTSPVDTLVTQANALLEIWNKNWNINLTKQTKHTFAQDLSVLLTAKDAEIFQNLKEAFESEKLNPKEKEAAFESLNKWVSDLENRSLSRILSYQTRATIKPKENTGTKEIVEWGSKKKKGKINEQFSTKDIKLEYTDNQITEKERKRTIDLFRKLSFMNQSLEELAKNKVSQETLTNLMINEKATLSPDQKEILNKIEIQMEKDLPIIEKIYRSKGIPQQALNYHSLRIYWEELRNALIQSGNKTDAWKDLIPKNISPKSSLDTQIRSNGYKIYINRIIPDQTITQIIEVYRPLFDRNYYEQLKSVRNPLSPQALKSFGPQFLVYSMAIGASIYLQSLSDPYFHGAEKNPENLQNSMMQNFSPLGIFSFYVFISANNIINERLYKLGMFVDGKAKTPYGLTPFTGKTIKSFAPSVGLGAAFFISSTMHEVLLDPSVRNCAKDAMNVTEDKTPKYISSCEESYLKWVSSGKMKQYGVDILSLIVSAKISHSILRSAGPLIRTTPWGASAFRYTLAKLGPRVLGWGSFFAGFFLFVEIHKILDHWPARPVKNLWIKSGINTEINMINNLIERELFNNVPFYEEMLKESKENQNSLPAEAKNKSLETLRSQFKAMGNKFQEWVYFITQLQNHSAHLWSKQVNKLFLPYEGSLQILKEMFYLSHFDHDQIIIEEEKGLGNFDKDFAEGDFLRNINVRLLFQFSKLTDWEKETLQNYCFSNPLLNLPATWTIFCKGDELPLNEDTIKNLSSEAIYIIHDFLDNLYLSFKRFEKNNKINQRTFKYYLSDNPNEIFSSDPEYAVQRLNFHEKINLAKRLLEKDMKEHSTSHYSNKSLSAGISILKGLNSQNPTSALHPISEFIELFDVYKKGERSFSHREEVFQILIKGRESYEVEQYKSHFLLSSDLYAFMTSAVCGIKAKTTGDFHIPHFFSNPDISIYNFQSLTYESLETACSFHFNADINMNNTHGKQMVKEFLFNRPVKIKEKKYETLYLALEDMLQEYPNTNALLSDFEKQSEKQLKELGGSLESDLTALTESYYKEVINFENGIPANSHLSEFLSYYDSQKSLNSFKTLESSIFQVNFWMNKLKQALIAGESGTHPMNTELGGLLNPWTSFDENQFDKAHQEVLSLLQFYHNTYIEEKKSYILSPDKSFIDTLNSLFREGGEEALIVFSGFNGFISDKDFEFWLMTKKLQNESLTFEERIRFRSLIKGLQDENKITQEEFQFWNTALNEGLKENKYKSLTISRFMLLQKKYQNSDRPVLMSSDIILAHIMANSIPQLQSPALLDSFNKNEMTPNLEPWEQTIHIIVFELNRSLNHFFTQLEPLKIKHNLQERASFSQ